MNAFRQEEYTFSEAEGISWMSSTLDESPIVGLPSADNAGRSWQEFMNYDGRSPNSTTSSEQASILDTSRLARSKEAYVPSSTGQSYVSQTSTVPTMAFEFGQAQMPQSYTFQPTEEAGQISPFSAYSRDNSTDAAIWNARLMPVGTPVASVRSPHGTNNTTRSPHSDLSTLNHDANAELQQDLSGKLKNKSANKNKKRKSPNDDEMDQELDDEERPGVKKTAHNMIEKRYRNNLNDKIAALRDAVPSLRIVGRNVSDGDDNDREDLDGLAPAHKLNKATVLSKATEYIRHLEKNKARQDHEIAELRSRLTNYERMVKAGRQVFHTPVSTPNQMFMHEEVFAASPGMATSAQAPPNGMIPIPESISNMRPAQLNQGSYNTPHIYPMHPTEPRRDDAAHGRRVPGPRGGMLSRVIIGGLTTLILLDGISEDEPEGNDIEARGLFSMPLPLGKMYGRNGLDTLQFARLALLLTAMAFVLAPLFNFKSAPKRKASQGLVRTKYSLASPIEFRQRAWLTAIQTVWVPQHTFILELAALCLKTVKLSTRNLIGWDGYSFITGFTREQEVARVKAWSIALDAQLAGGDADISISRLVLTLLASGTLPSTPARLMLKSLHIRVLFWEVAHTGYGSWLMLDELSIKLARVYWNAARQEHRARLRSREDAPLDDEDTLPHHLAQLLELDADDVLVDAIVQRAYNLAWNHPTSAQAGENEAMDNVVEDLHIASPLDALAAWWSTTVLNRIISVVIEKGFDHIDEIIEDLDLTLQVAPPPSSARVRAMTAKSILIKKDRALHVEAALGSLPELPHVADNQNDSPTPSYDNFVGDGPVPAEISHTMTLAKSLVLAESSDYQSRLTVAAFINQLLPLPGSLSLLSFAASLQLLEFCVSSPTLLNDAHIGLERLASGLRVFVGGSKGPHMHLSSIARAEAVKRCLAASKTIVGLVDIEADIDQGYASQSDGEGPQPKAILKHN